MMSIIRQPRPVRVGPGTAVGARAVDMPPGHRVAAHEHAEWAQLLYAASGVLDARVGHRRYVVPPQQAMWIPPGVSHAVHAPGGARFRSLYFGAPHRERLAPVTRVIEMTPLMRELVLEIIKLCDTPEGVGAGDGLLLEVLLDRLHRQPAADLDLPLPEDTRLEPLVQALQKDPGDPRTLAQWAPAVGMSIRNISRVFRRDVGMGFSRWRQRMRILAALDPLERGQSVTRVALDLGYASPSAFVAAFRQVLGRTPGDYLRGRVGQSSSWESG